MALANLFAGVPTAPYATCTSGDLNSATLSTAITCSVEQATAFSVNELVVAWRVGTYATPDLDPLARIGKITARTNTTITISWGLFGTPLTALTGSPRVAPLFSDFEKAQARDLLISDLAQSVNGRQSTTLSTNTTLAIGDSGMVQLVDTDGVVVTLPATVVGYTFIIRNASTSVGSVGISVSPNASDKIAGNGFTATDDKDAINTKATARPGDEIRLVGDGVNGWFVQHVTGIWAREA